MNLDKGQEDLKSNQKNPDIKWMLTASVEEILQKALEENWHQGTFDKWLRIKEVQFIEKIAFRNEIRQELLCSMIFGFKQHEKGNNLEKAIDEFNRVMQDD